MAPEVLTVAHPQQPYEALLQGRINTVPIIMVDTCGGYDMIVMMILMMIIVINMTMMVIVMMIR